VHPTCYCYWLANSLSVFALRMRVHPWMFWICFLNWIVVLLYWFVCCIYPYCLQWVLVIFISSPPCLLVVFILYYWLVLYYSIIVLNCIIALYCVFAFLPLSLQWVPVISLLLTHMSACVVCLQEGRSICVLSRYCILISCTLEHWHWLLLLICLLP